MPAPFYDAIKGTTAGTPGTGAFTPNAASTGAVAWSKVPAGWIGKVRFEDGAAWGIEYCYWNGTTLSRSSTQDSLNSDGTISSSTGAHLTLTSAATAELVEDSLLLSPDFDLGMARGYMGIPNTTTTPFAVGLPAATVTGTATAAAILTTNYMTEQSCSYQVSATTANAQAGISSAVALVYSTTSGRGGFCYHVSFGVDILPTGPRLFTGVSSATFIAQTIEPSAFTAQLACFAKDSTDTNIQLLVNNNAVGGTKTDTGIPLTATGWYRAWVWAEPGGGRIFGMLWRVDTGALWIGSTVTDIPPTTTTLLLVHCGGLSATTGTAFGIRTSAMFVRRAM